MAGETGNGTAGAGAWKKRLLTSFVGLAAVGLIVGLAVGLKPERSAKNALTPVTTHADEQPVVVTPVTPEKIEVEQVPVTTTKAPTAAVPVPNATQAPTKPAAGNLLLDALNGLNSLTPDAIKAMDPKTTDSLVGAKALQQLTGSVAKANDKMTDAVGVLGVAMPDEAEMEKVLATMVQETSMAGGCTPQTGAELRAMLEDNSRCTFVTLLPGYKYEIPAINPTKSGIAITGRKVVIGNPIALPTVDGSGLVRLFHVMPGGELDLQFMRTFRGGGELIATIPVLRGGSVLVEAGGRLNSFGVIFTHNVVGIPPILIAPDLSRALRVFGGQVCVMGGVATITLSHFWTMQPGVMLRELYVIGAEMLTVAGVAIISGCTMTHSALFINGGGVGFLLAHLGGVLIVSGLALTLNFMVVHAAGAGVLCFVGGGVGIFSGVVWTGNLGAYNHFGTGFNLFNGGGVLVLSGCVISTNLGVAAQSGTAIMISLGGGTLTVSGVAQDLVVGCEYYSGAGVLSWVGAGSAVLVGLSQGRSIGVGAVYGIGGTMAVGAGDLIVVGNANVDNLGCASVVLIGGNYFLGAGVFVEIGSPMAKNAGVLFGIFLGFDAFVGAGTAVVAGAPAAVNAGVAYLNKGVSQYFINGQRVAANVSAFSTAKNGTIVPKKFKVRALLDSVDAIATGVAATGQALAAPAASGDPTSFIVLDGENKPLDAIAEPSDFVKAVKAGPLGAVAAPMEPIPYATVDGAAACNACGFAGAVAEEFVGAGAGACTSEGADCTLEGVKVLGFDGQAGGSLPSWALQAGQLFDMETDTLTGLLDSQVVTATLDLGCAPTAGSACVSQAALEEAVKASLGSDCARLNVEQFDKNAKHPALALLGAGILPTRARKLEGAPVTEAFDLAFTTHTPECTALVTEWVKSVSAEQLKLPGVDKVAAEYGATYTAKGMGAAEAAQATLPAVVSAMRTGVVPGVLVSAADDKLSPGRMALPTLAQGGDAVVALTGFVPNKPVSFSVTNKCLAAPAAKALGDKVGTMENVAVGEFTPTAKGAVNVPFTVPAELPAGTYSVRAEQSGLGFCSQPFQIE